MMESSQAPSPAPLIRQPDNSDQKYQETIRKLFLSIGELYVSRGELFGEYQAAMKQIEEMSKVISQLRAEKDNGKLVKPTNHDPI